MVVGLVIAVISLFFFSKETTLQPITIKQFESMLIQKEVEKVIIVNDKIVEVSLKSTFPLDIVVFDHQNPPLGLLHELVQCGKGVGDVVAAERLLHVVEGAHRVAPTLVVLDRDDAHRQVARSRVVLEEVQQRPSAAAR
ncbi:MAG: ATP-dependent metallopeptidase FtsH/Yme1/Tma family protein, partial [Aquirufa sp.]